MTPIRNMTAGQMVELMGEVAGLNEKEAMFMFVIASERDYHDLEDIPEDDWFAMLDEAVQRAAHDGPVKSSTTETLW